MTELYGPLGREASEPRLAKAATLAAFMVFSLGLGACSRAVVPTPTSTLTPSAVPTPTAQAQMPEIPRDVLVRGAELYTADCQVCHGDREGNGGIGGAPPHNEAGHTWHHPDAQLKGWTLNGRLYGSMPAFKDTLAEQDVEAILAYVKTWWTEEQRQSQADISRRYQEALDKQKKGK